jgi:hypothetical protein
MDGKSRWIFIYGNSSPKTAKNWTPKPTKWKKLESLIHKYPQIKALFLRFNTGLPSSAPVERLLSARPLILTARRNRLSDEFFKMLLILKVHKSVLLSEFFFTEMTVSAVFSVKLQE